MSEIGNVSAGPVPVGLGMAEFFGEIARNSYDDGVRVGYNAAREAVYRWCKHNQVSLDVFTSMFTDLDAAEPEAYRRSMARTGEVTP